MVDSAIFWAFALLSVGGALCAVLSRSVIFAALSLIVVFLSIAGVYVLNNADFLAIAQVIIYAVGLTIIMLFAIMFTGDKPLPPRKGNRVAQISYGIVLLYVFGLLVRAISGAFPPEMTVPRSPALVQALTEQGSTTLLGSLLFKTYALPFEIASVLLLAAMIGAIIIAKKRFVDTGAIDTGLRFAVDEASAPPEEAIAALRAARLGSQSQETKTAPHKETEAVAVAGAKEGEQ